MLKRIVSVLLAMLVFILPASAEALPAFDFEDRDIETMLDGGELSVNGMIELNLTGGKAGQALNIHIIPSDGSAGKRNLLMNVPIYCRDMSLKSGVCFDVEVPEYTERPRYIEFNLQFDMPGRAQTVAGQPIYYTGSDNVTVEGEVQAGNVVRLDSGFKGRVYVPFAAFQSTAGDIITSSQIYRMYMIFDCDLFPDYAFLVDNIAFYEQGDLPEAEVEPPPDFIVVDPDVPDSGGTVNQPPQTKPGTETITHTTEPEYKIMTRLFYKLEWFDYLFIALGVAAAAGLTVWLVILIKKRRKLKLAADTAPTSETEESGDSKG